MSEERVNEIMDEMDNDHDNKVSETEFEQFLMEIEEEVEDARRLL